MKKSCKGCRALRGEGCALGYKMQGFSRLNDNYTPLEECPKPKTYDQYIRLANQDGKVL